MIPIQAVRFCLHLLQVIFPDSFQAGLGPAHWPPWAAGYTAGIYSILQVYCCCCTLIGATVFEYDVIVNHILNPTSSSLLLFLHRCILQLVELAQTHVQVDDAIQPSIPLSSPSPPVFNISQHQGLFEWISSSHQVAKVLEFQLQHQSFQGIFRIDFL